ncbi:hypothetical protein ACEQ8H_001648 [Pleosporales sp. CAS-2024a]
MTNIPIVDFAKAADGTKEEREHVARKLDEAFASAGFVYLKNHGVPHEQVERCFEWVSEQPTYMSIKFELEISLTLVQSKKFFDLPHETKMLASHPPGASHHRGYSAPGLEKISQHEYDPEELTKLRDVPDFKESFEIGNVNDKTQPNIWLPEDKLPGFRAFMESYIVLSADLVHRILDSLSIALKLPEPGLSPTHSENLSQMRLLHYPPIAAEELAQNKRTRINAHSDFGTLTRLFQDAVGGLEVEDQNVPGTFLAAKPIQDTVLVNSNDRWRSAVHRVGIPPRIGEGVVSARYSIPFFAVANMETVIEALPGSWDEKNPIKYEPVTAWNYVQMRMKALYED